MNKLLRFFNIIFFITINASNDVYKLDKVLPPVYYNNIFTIGSRKGLEENLKNLKKIRGNKPIVVVEVGSFLGASAFFMSKFLNKEDKIYCVDIWVAEEKWPLIDHVRPVFYQQFLSNVIHQKLQDQIIPMRMMSTKAAKVFNLKADLIYIDALHWENDVYDDIMSWYPHLATDGIMCGDDFMWTHPSAQGYPVKNAVERTAKELGLKIKTTGADNWFWQFVK